MDGKKYKLEKQSLSESRTLITGVDKGIRIVERSNGSIIPALVIDCNSFFFKVVCESLKHLDSHKNFLNCEVKFFSVKKAAFFDAVPLVDMVHKVLMKNDSCSSIPPLDANLFNHFVRKLNDIVRGIFPEEYISIHLKKESLNYYHFPFVSPDGKIVVVFVDRLFDKFFPDLRLEHSNCTNKSFLASGLSDKPIGQIRYARCFSVLHLYLFICFSIIFVV